VVSRIAEGLLGLLFPSACVLCHRELRGSLVGGICEDCWPGITPWRGPICDHCGLPLPGSIRSSNYLCADCRRSRFPFEAARSFGVYSGALRAALLNLKFRGHERLGTRLGSLLARPWRALESVGAFGAAPVIIPVPLHPSKERERGYNQAYLLALGVCRALRSHGVAKRPAQRVLVRRRVGVPQSGLSLHARRENVRGVFAVTAPERVRDRDVVLVDDVLTTGATASACTVALKRAGVCRVGILTLARATPQFPDVAQFPGSHTPTAPPASSSGG
jgi:ComF family protein